MNHLLPPGTAITEQDVEALARYLLEDAEFQALNLGTWFGTTEGRIITAAVMHALPPVYRPYAHLFVDALQRAAQLQHQGKKQEAAPWLGLQLAPWSSLAGWSSGAMAADLEIWLTPIPRMVAGRPLPFRFRSRSLRARQHP
jgi:hypothetical protein